MARLTIKRPDAAFYRGWGFVAICAIALTIAVFISRGGLQTVNAGVNDPSGCRVEVIADQVNVRSQPTTSASIVEILHQGDLRPAEKVVQDGFRKLTEGKWVSEGLLRTVPGANCG